MTKKEVARLFSLIKEFYEHFEVSEKKIESWQWVLEEQDFDAVIKNTKRYVLDNKFPPTVTDIKQRKMEAYSNDFLKKAKQWEEEAKRANENQ